MRRMYATWAGHAVHIAESLARCTSPNLCVGLANIAAAEASASPPLLRLSVGQRERQSARKDTTTDI